jgi:methylated-DNA-[protein]-cysteine S-methyltransferase
MPAIFVSVMTKPVTATHTVIDSPVGRLAIGVTGEQLGAIDFVGSGTPLSRPASSFAKEVVSQLQQYFRHADFVFDLPVSPGGTPHQNKVWALLRTIKPGCTMTYGQLAKSIGSGARAVGNSCRRNPVSIVIPCHRVTAANGIGGYGGHVDGEVLQRKQWLLRHEGSYPEDT